MYHVTVAELEVRHIPHPAIFAVSTPQYRRIPCCHLLQSLIGDYLLHDRQRQQKPICA